jgi:hypothetical protein
MKTCGLMTNVRPYRCHTEGVKHCASSLEIVVQGGFTGKPVILAAEDSGHTKSRADPPELLRNFKGLI